MDGWDGFRLFLAVARAGTLTAAAEELGVGISTLHRHLAALEHQLGAALFTKGPAGYQLTNVGEALLPQAEEAEEAILAATRTVVGHDQQASGEVRLTLPLMLLPKIAPHLAAFSRVCSRIRLVLQASDVQLDLKHETDLALRATTQPQDTAIGRNLGDISWSVFQSTATTQRDALPWIHYRGMDQVPAVQWRRKHVTAHPIMEVQGVMGMLSVLPESGAQGLLPTFVGDLNPTLRRVGAPVATNQLWLLVHADLRRSARVRAVTDFLVPRLLACRREFAGEEP